MRTGMFAIPVMIFMSSHASAGSSQGENDGNTTIVRNGRSVAVVTQSGDPDHAVVHVERQPSRTFIYRQSGGSTSVVTQSSDPADIALQRDRQLPWMRSFPGR